ncbi:YwqH-like family protein [Shouchella lonarensis]|uniref:Uncharacterized protein n=1 Tax=Shouchella lonarensis TaxID=1464122 RepID=A0A1G6HQH6_9BACI|nr:DUF5082 family protein [Shouchella lonarensis]SDB95746.1 protein of unknown function [Shouchella lonarensis]
MSDMNAMRIERLQMDIVSLQSRLTVVQKQLEELGKAREGLTKVKDEADGEKHLVSNPELNHEVTRGKETAKHRERRASVMSDYKKLVACIGSMIFLIDQKMVSLATEGSGYMTSISSKKNLVSELKKS